MVLVPVVMPTLAAIGICCCCLTSPNWQTRISPTTPTLS